MTTFDTLTQRVLKIRPQDLRDDLTPKDVPDWDSMNYLLFIAELEKEYNVSFTMDEVLEAKTLGDVKRCLTSRSILL